ncbi:MAG: phosphatidylcholine/phosphatidylserine synthase [Phycisphaerales bacterium]|nr:phosphatidylcholine/phosphatidylserine synthase [Phycisphaerales bacterium]
MNTPTDPSRPLNAQQRRRRLARRRFRRRALAPIAVTPTLLTLANLVCGFAAIHYASKPVAESSIFQWSTLTVAGSLVFLGMFFDAIDGSVARLTRSTSDLGAQLDSLADMVTFGVAPAYIMLRLVAYYYLGSSADAAAASMTVVGPEVDSLYGKGVWAIAAFYICCAALRLARFNVEVGGQDEGGHRTFRGLPTPGAAGVVASLIVLHQHLLFTKGADDSITLARISALLLPVVTLGVGLAMVSAIPYPHIINRYLRRQRDFGSMVRIVLPVVAAIWFLQATLAVVCTTYALSGPLRVLTRRIRLKSPMRTEPKDDSS